MKSFTHFFAKVTQVVRKVVQVREQEMYLQTHSATKCFKCRQHISHNLFIIWCLVVAKKLAYNILETDPSVSSSALFIVLSKSLSFISALMFGPSNTPAFSFSELIFGNLVQMYPKQCPCLSKALTNCFI